MPGPGRASSFYHIVNMNKGKKNKENDPENSTRDEVFEEFEIPDNEPVFTVSVVSRLLDIPVWVLKKLDSEEIVCPKRSRGNDRLYSKKNVSRVRYYWALMERRKVKVAGLRVIKEIIEEKEGSDDKRK